VRDLLAVRLPIVDHQRLPDSAMPGEQPNRLLMGIPWIIVHALVLVTTYLLVDSGLRLHYGTPEPSPFWHFASSLWEGVFGPAQLNVYTIADEYRINGCPRQEYTVNLVSRAPKMMLIEDFLTPVEAEFLIMLAYVPNNVK
jgi:hypothetical protein